MKNTFVVVLLGSVLLLAITSHHPRPAPADTGRKGGKADGKAQIEELRAEIKKLQGLVPDQAAVMSHLGYHWSNLWFAIEQENWALADFYLSEVRSNLKWAVRTKPVRKSGPYTVKLKDLADAVENSNFTPMKKAIAKKDKKQCIKIYDETLGSCYACHKASDKPYLRPRRPTAPEARVMNFDPKAREPK
jgi:hypothetical protein